MESTKVSVGKPADLSSYFCPECKHSADHIAATIVEKRLLVNTFKCPNGHRFSKEVTLKHTEGFTI